ncbi:DUF11 domain-containing protein [Streptomyces sp. C]|uniref:DUF11 domain-containing protein n=1 Tax=Streptomyces sp. C TaxID=253839 RepID=UPI0001B562F6|nr:DUF11 domain-containing protein [Streptomyces sp. C]
MSVHTLRRRLCALGTVVGLGVVLPFTTGAVPAFAVAQISLTKTHEGDFARGGQGVYHIKATNTGTATVGTLRLTDTYPQGLTGAGISVSGSNFGAACSNDPAGLVCELSLGAGGTVSIDVTVDVASDTTACTVTNSVTVSGPEDGVLVTANDPTTITGGSCPDDDGGSVLPVNLSGVVTLFNNISTNNNILSPGGRNTSTQNLGINAP